MKRFDVLVIGGTRAGGLVADALSAAGRSVAMVRSPLDDAADRVLFALEGLPAQAAPPVRFDVLTGPARFVFPRRLHTADGDVEAPRFVLACGAIPAGEWDLGRGPFPPVLDALTGAVPSSAVVLGSGPAAVMAADRLSRNGSRVTLIAQGPRILPLEDDSVAGAVAGRLRSRGVTLALSASALGWAPSGVTRWSADGVSHEVKTDMIFPETDVRPDIADLGLAEARVYVDAAGRVVVDEEMRTSAPHIWAVGHAVTPGASLAEMTYQAELAAHNARMGFLGRKKAEPARPPTVLRTVPPAARVGLTEAEARSRFRDAVVAAAPFFDEAGTGDASGLVKIIGRRRGGRLLGAHAVGLAAAETILFFDLLLRSEIPIQDVPDRRHFPIPGGTDAVYRALRAWTVAAYGE